MRRLDPVRSLGAVMIGVMALTLVSVTPVAAADPALECRGGGPDYWATNPWPTAFKIPRMFQNPNKKRTYVKKWTPFNDVFRWRKGKDSEGKIFANKYRLRNAAEGKGSLLKSVAGHAVAALLNAGEPDNTFSWTKGKVIKQFQVYWDGTADMGKTKARKALRQQLRDHNEGACPTP